MTLDRDAARALFDNAPAPAASVGGSTPFAAASPFGEADTGLSDRMSGKSARKGPDWRLIAPIGVAGLCAVAVLVIAQTRDPAEPGKSVAVAEMAPLTPPPILPPPVETATVATPPASSIVDPPAVRPAPVVRTTVRAAPVRRAAPPRTVAAAPSAADASTNVSAREPQPYMATPSVVVPTPTPVTPAAPPPIVTPEPLVFPAPTADPTVPPQL